LPKPVTKFLIISNQREEEKNVGKKKSLLRVEHDIVDIAVIVLAFCG